MVLGEGQAAIATLEQSIAMTRAGASDAVFAQALNSVALHESTRGHHTRALTALTESIAH